MTSSTDFQKLWFLYKTEGSPSGISINDFCLNRGVSYSEFEKWYKKNMRSVADRAAMYTTIVKELEKEKGVKILRQPCIFHLRHYFVDGYLVDHRVESILILINALFYIERMFKEKEEDQSPEARLRYRLKWSLPIMNRLTQKIEEIEFYDDVKELIIDKNV